MRRTALLLAALLLPIQKASAGITINADAIKESVVFIYPANDSGSVDAAKPLGTGFFVSVPNKSRVGEYLFLFTARHVLDPSWAKCPNSKALSKIYLRLNLKTFNSSSNETGIDFVPVALSGSDPHTKVFEPSDPQIDGVVVALNPNDFVNGKYAFSSVSIADFATEAEISLLGTGDSIVSAGLVPGAQGQRRNYPVFKFGAISNLMDEPFDTACVQGGPQVPEKVWLLSVNLFPGASGSAIFYAPPGSGGIRFGAAVSRPCLIGIQSSSVNGADVSAMTPIEPIFKIIEGLQLPDADLFRGIKPVPAPTQ